MKNLLSPQKSRHLLAFVVVLLLIGCSATLAEETHLSLWHEDILKKIDACLPNDGVLIDPPPIKNISITHEHSLLSHINIVLDHYPVGEGYVGSSPANENTLQYQLRIDSNGQVLGVVRNDLTLKAWNHYPDSAFLSEESELKQAALQCVDSYLKSLPTIPSDYLTIKKIVVNEHDNAYRFYSISESHPLWGATDHTVSVTIEYPIDTLAFKSGQTITMVWSPLCDDLIAWHAGE